MQEGADVNHIGEYGDTALFDAIRAHNVSMVRTLVAAGADVNTLKNGTPVLLWAMDYLYQNYMAPESEDLTEIGEILINHPSINPDTLSFPQTLNSAIRYEYSAGVARAIIARSATLSNKDEILTRALLQAIEFDNLNVVKLAIEAGANVNAFDQSRRSYFNAAVYHDNAEIVDFLLMSGADISLTDSLNLTALDSAYRRSNFDQIISRVTQMQKENPANWQSMQTQLLASNRMRKVLDGSSEELLAVCLPEGNLLQQLILANLSLYEPYRVATGKIAKLREIKAAVEKRMTNAGEENPQALANLVVIDLLQDPQKLQEVVDVHSFVAGINPTKGHDSILHQAIKAKTGQEMPETAATSIHAYIGGAKALTLQQNSQAAMGVQKVINPLR